MSCLFHWQERPLGGGGTLSLLRHYFQDVWKAPLDVPLADELIARRRIGWVLFGVTALLALATIGGLIAIQTYIGGLPAGPERKTWNDIGVPAVALSGSLLTILAALGSYKVMPMPTVQLRPIRISAEHIWLTGAATEYLSQIPEWDKT